MAIDLGELATALGKIILRFRVRRNTAINWTASNEVLLDGEIGWDRTANKIKIGDGVTGWNSLTYVGGGGGSGGGGSAPLSPDIAPSSPTPYDDEFEFGTALDTSGSRRSGATGWTVYGTLGVTVDAGLAAVPYGLSGNPLLAVQPAPVGDCTFIMKVKRESITSTGAMVLCLFNSTSGKVVSAQLFSPTPTLVVQHGTFNTTTFAYTGATNVNTGTTITNTDQPMYLRIRIVSGVIYYSFSSIGQKSTWYEMYNETVAAFLGSVTHVGMMFFPASVSACDFFRRTA